MFSTKITIIVRDDLAIWQKLNVTAFLTTGIISVRELLEGLRDADEWQAHPWLDTVLTASAAVAYNTAGYFTRLIELDGVGFGGGSLRASTCRSASSYCIARRRSRPFATLGCLECSPRSCPQRRPSAI